MTQQEQTSKLEESPSPRPFNEQYYKSRKQLVLYSALLFAWAFVGIEVPENPFANVNIHIKSPQAVPWVLIALIIYFGYRTIVEWMQSDPRRRALRISRVDFLVTLAIPAAAVGTLVIQSMLEIQIADFILNYRVLIAMIAFVVTSLMTVTVAGLIKLPKERKRIEHFRDQFRDDDEKKFAESLAALHVPTRKALMRNLVISVCLNLVFAPIAVRTLGILVYCGVFLVSIALGVFRFYLYTWGLTIKVGRPNGIKEVSA